MTTVDISIKTRMTKEMMAEIAKIQTPAAQYVAEYGDKDYMEYMWDELAVAGWLDPSIITRQTRLYLDIDISHTANYGNVLLWDNTDRPGLDEQLVDLPEDLDGPKFYKLFMDLLAQPATRRSTQRIRNQARHRISRIIWLRTWTSSASEVAPWIIFAIVPRLLAAEEKINATRMEIHAGGVTANNLTQVARLGASTGWLGLIGDHDNGRIIKKAFEHDHMDVSGIEVVRRANFPLSPGFRWMRPASAVSICFPM